LIEQYSLTVHIINQSGNIKMTTLLKKWCYYLDGKIIKKRSTQEIHVTPNFIIKTENTVPRDNSFRHQHKYAHWFYSGNWKFYDNKGKLIIERNYQSGKLASETILK
jgi:antitoxin component YwqK of YwqJK toxin-antitoxin module